MSEYRELEWERWIDIYCFQMVLIGTSLEAAGADVRLVGDGPTINMTAHLRECVAGQQRMKSVLPRHDVDAMYSMPIEELRALLVTGQSEPKDEP